MDWIAIKIGTALIGAGNTILDKKLATRPSWEWARGRGGEGAHVGQCLSLPRPLAPSPPRQKGGILFMIAVWLYYGVMAKEEVSQVTLLMRLTGIQTMILSALFLGERLTVMQHAAFVIGTLGGVLLVLTPGKAGIRLNRAAGTILLITLAMLS